MLPLILVCYAIYVCLEGRLFGVFPFFFLLFCLCFLLNLGIAITMDGMLSINQVSVCSVMELHAGLFRMMVD